ncbi:GntR family transcriptional regulator [Profundibacterium mesophilum]|uniref:Phosphoglycolate phosphatase n=1 Tax=Profundibacterium mesophilum KAUST100406-0324 TaxID=1037889 RepID=A0A921NQD9_9RHOB|nr:GntR family transcriptional regulator [Profundibacterium mesophilum]KAF0676851.1 phosphoglycolate phosphatase [Profundibacterium mesophilum KAUST100406-0324]
MCEEDRGDGQGGTAYRRLLEEIRAGRLAAGDRLRETELAERLGVSRTPVREAIRQLEADGLVTHVPRQGASVRGLDYAEVMELYEMRAVLEGTAARLATRAASQIELDELAALNEELVRAGASPEAFDLNRQFHAALLDAAKNRFLSRSIQGLQKALMILGPTTLTAPERAERAVEEHSAVLDALMARDGLRAEAAMRAHIEAAQRVRVRAVRARAAPLDDGDML